MKKTSIIRIGDAGKYVINKIAEEYNGGGHKFASGAKPPTFEEAMKLMEDLDLECKKYIESKEA